MNHHHHRFDQHTLSSGYGGGGKNGCCLFIKIGQRSTRLQTSLQYYYTLAGVHGNTNSPTNTLHVRFFATTATSIVATPLLHNTRLLFVYFPPRIQVCVCLIHFTLFFCECFFLFVHCFGFTHENRERERPNTNERESSTGCWLSFSSLFSHSSSPFSSSVRRASC